MAECSIPYGMSDYLDISAPNWDGLVLGDYQALMPLPWNAKLFGFKQLYQPLSTQQLGVFVIGFHPSTIILEFIKKIPDHFKYINVNLNENNDVENIEKEGFSITTKTNLILSLKREYSEIEKGFHKAHKRNIKKGIKSKLIPCDITEKQFLELFSIHTAKKIGYTKDILLKYQNLMRYLIPEKRGFISACKNESGKIVAANFYLISNFRIIHLLSTITPEGKESRAQYFLLDNIIREYAMRNCVLDFEGSSVPGVARFYKGFGAEEVQYHQIIRNRLPFPLNKLKP